MQMFAQQVGSACPPSLKESKPSVHVANSSASDWRKRYWHWLDCLTCGSLERASNDVRSDQEAPKPVARVAKGQGAPIWIDWSVWCASNQAPSHGGGRVQVLCVLKAAYCLRAPRSLEKVRFSVASLRLKFTAPACSCQFGQVASMLICQK
ncbi:unnamed protein product [Effrenium voratum]|uniref:Uncharacterized protein n=1 Tax=Effrenium voratum TaxID=2562239 RepID=A0AA36IYM1_9DINO|nr:unnamed protein product [Effrenium voratum]